VLPEGFGAGCAGEQLLHLRPHAVEAVKLARQAAAPEPLASLRRQTRIAPRKCPIMNSPEPAARAASNNSPARRIAAAVTLAALLFVVLWVTMFSMVTSLLIGAACCAVIVTATSVSDVFEMLLDAVAAVIFGALAVIAAIFAAIIGLFGF